MVNHLKDVAANLAIAGGFGGLCGFLSYLLKVEEGKPFKWSELALHTTISAVCGLAAFTLLDELAGFSPSVCGTFSGVAGWMGTRLIRIVEVRVEKKLNE